MLNERFAGTFNTIPSFNPFFKSGFHPIKDASDTLKRRVKLYKVSPALTVYSNKSLSLICDFSGLITDFGAEAGAVFDLIFNVNPNGRLSFISIGICSMYLYL